ncbi:SET domain-containing protein [Emericellopsis cladophorae]|uniref:SET domain-containing protein n=1 Tax=Emericellopsis cladophorae TaxID=2686198 RepID=A0A9P9XU31_9HYPO|nr:SET domain-containing protein [Emericellopsis cladophorae]KAI6777760.1 SET domain-containing protein [Emericellopsis cladophorae]
MGSMSAHGSEAEHESIFKVAILHGKGRGLVATDPIAFGTTIFTEVPYLKLEDNFAKLNPPAANALLGQQLRDLDKGDQRNFLQLRNLFPGLNPLLGTFCSNALQIHDCMHAVFRHTTLINHDCIPNARYFWDKDVGRQVVRSLRRIDMGEELTVAYIMRGTRAERQEIFKTRYGFECTCALCSAPDEIVEQSDARQEIIRKHDALVDSDRVKTNPVACMKSCRHLAYAVKQEYKADKGQSRLYQPFEEAMNTCGRHGDRARVVMFAKLAVASLQLCFGYDHKRTSRVRRLAMHPDTMEGFGTHSMDWETWAHEIPENLGGSQFDEWLWRAGEWAVPVTVQMDDEEWIATCKRLFLKEELAPDADDSDA